MARGIPEALVQGGLGEGGVVSVDVEVVRRGRDVLVEEADEEGCDNGGYGGDHGQVESPGEGVEHVALHFES